MKLKDIAAPRITRKLQETRSWSNDKIIKTEELMWPEIEELQRADASGLVASCTHLEDDERELADTILNRLRDISYHPSPIIYQAIRAINARLLISLDVQQQAP